MYSIHNVSDMLISGIKPGNTKKIKNLTTKHIKYSNLGLLVIKKEEHKKPPKESIVLELDKKDEVNK